MVYLVIILVVLLLSTSSTAGNYTGSWRKGKYLILFLFTLVAGFAYMLGSDTPEYVYFYNHLPSLADITWEDINSYRYQPGFTLFCSAIRGVSNNYLLYQIIHAFFINLVIIHFINKYSVNPYVAILVYCIINFLEFNFEIQRESIAVVLGLLAFEFQDKKKYFPYLVLVILAYYFHFSALAILLYPIISVFNVSKSNSFIFLLIAAFAPWVWRAIPNAELFLLFSTDSEFYSGYINQELNTSYNIFYYFSFYLTNLIIPVGSLYFLKDRLPNYTIFVLIYILFKMLSLFSYGFYRFSNYFVCFYWLALAESLIYLHNKYSLNKFLLYIIILFVVGYTNQTKLFWYDDDRGEYIYERYLPYKSVDKNQHY